MGCRDSSKVRVHPRNEPAQFVRFNGLTRPIHYLQIVAWVFLLIFAFMYFGIVAPAVTMPWKPAAFVCTGLVYVVHLITHIIATTKNPADKNAKVQMKQNHQMPEFDRSKHQHVIENEFCHLCETYVNKSSKHCRACNKCVMDFDHHCLWLNNCVGSVNYKYFLTTIITAFIGTLVIMAVSLFVFINSFLDFQLLDQDVWWKSSTQELFQVFVGILIVLCLICSILLGQLMFFHLYLIRRGLTTYEYIQQARQKKENNQHNIDSVGDMNDDENDIATCTRPPSVIDTAVTSTAEGGAVVVKVPTTSKDDGQTTNSAKENQALQSVPPDAFMANGFTLANGNIKSEVTEDERNSTPSRSEFTNAAFSAEESKNVNANSNAIPVPYLSVNGTSSPASSLGELQPWENSVATETNPPRLRNGNFAYRNGVTGTLTSEKQQSRSGMLAPPAGMESGSKRVRRQERKRVKKSRMSSEDGLPRPLPVLPENANPTVSQGSLRKKTVLPPLRNSVEWASSSEDLQSIISSQRKLPSLTPSSSVNSFASFVSGSVVSNRYNDVSHA